MNLRQLLLGTAIAAAVIVPPTAVSAQIIANLNDIRTDGFVVVTSLPSGARPVSLGTTLFAFDIDSSGHLIEFWVKANVICTDTSMAYNRLYDFWKMSGSQMERPMTYDEIEKYFPERRVWLLRRVICEDTSVNSAASFNSIEAYRDHFISRLEISR